MPEQAGKASYQKVGVYVQKGATRCKAASSRFLKTSTDGADTTSNGSLFQGSTTRAENAWHDSTSKKHCSTIVNTPSHQKALLPRHAWRE